MAGTFSEEGATSCSACPAGKPWPATTPLHAGCAAASCPPCRSLPCSLPGTTCFLPSLGVWHRFFPVLAVLVCGAKLRPIHMPAWVWSWAWDARCPPRHLEPRDAAGGSPCLAVACAGGVTCGGVCVRWRCGWAGWGGSRMAGWTAGAGLGLIARGLVGSLPWLRVAVARPLPPSLAASWSRGIRAPPAARMLGATCACAVG